LPEVISNTSPLQYLHQLELLHVLPRLVAGPVIVPQAVVEELAAGRDAGLNLPATEKLDWIRIRQPGSLAALPLASDLGAGEAGALALALESRGALVLLDDGRARQIAAFLGLKHRGTLGVLLDAKRAGLIPEVKPFLDQLNSLRFRLDTRTRSLILSLAGEE
jgi:uncharacterized protein